MRLRNELALKAFSRHFQEETSMIHFGVITPLLENFTYALALFRKKEQKSMLDGKELILRLLSYQRADGTFPDSMHLLWHKGVSWKKNIWIAASLFLILQEFEKVIDKVSKEMMRAALERLITAAATFDVGFDLKAIIAALKQERMQLEGAVDFEVVQNLVVAHKLASKEEKARLEPLLSSYLVDPAKCYQGPFGKILQYKGYPLKSIFELSFLEEMEASDLVWMDSVLATDLTHLKGTASWVRQRDLKEESSTLMRAFLSKEKGCTAVLESTHRALFDSERDCYTIFLEGLYEEDAHEVALFVTLDPSISIRLNGETSSIFREMETIKMESTDHSAEVSFRLKEGEGRFIGHVSLDAKPFEIEKGGVYDRKISIRTVERSVNCVLELFIHWKTH